MTDRHDEPAWLTAALDQKVAWMEQTMRAEGITPDMLDEMHIVMTFLTEPEQDNPFALARWEHTCDNCGKFAPHQLHQGVSTKRLLFGKQRLAIQFGCCTACKDAD